MDFTRPPQKQKDVPVYVYVNEDTLTAYPLEEAGRLKRRNLITQPSISFPESIPQQNLREPHLFKKYSFDLDVLTIPFKYRPTADGVPRQLNTQFNGALYAGYRTDRYRIRYSPTPLNVARREITHFGFSVGYFSGIGAETITPLVTNHIFQDEYDGIVWMNGVGGFIGINNFTFGLGIGLDYLLDHNRKHWVYQGKPWLGLALGLNVN